MENVYLTALSGSGENGRNCYLIAVNDSYILLDCGVKREIYNGQVGFYPPLTKEIVSRIKLVFLSHCHEDHVAALPLLYELGYNGNVYATAETVAETPVFIRKWQNFVKKNGGILPFSEEASRNVKLCPIELGKQKIEGISFETGRSGHVLGGVWYSFQINGKSILYTGDMCLQPVSLGMDVPHSSFNAAIMNSAYAGKIMIQEQQYQALLSSVQKALTAGGKVLLPVPQKGRGIDLFLFLKKKLPNTRIYVEQDIIDSLKSLSEKEQWIQEPIDTGMSPNIRIIETDEQRQVAICDKEPSVILTPDGMITTDISVSYLDALKGDEKNLIIITGHAAAGTPGAGILDDSYRSEHKILASGEKIIFKVHLDDNDICNLAEETGAKDIILFHSDAVHTKHIKSILQQRGINAETLQYPSMLEVK